MACPRCGSWSVRADRSLAGRMVCGRCGTPLQGVKGGGVGGGGFGGWRWALLAVLAIAAALAVMAPGSRQSPLPDAPFDRPHDRWQ